MITTALDTPQHERASQMVFFSTLVREQNFTAAALSLGVSVSQVSKQLGLLEKSLNVKLVQRTTRSFQLTEAGEEYFSICGKVCDAVREGNLKMKDASSSLSGVIKLGLAQSLGTLHIIPALEKLTRLYPDLNIQLRLFDHKADMIADGLDLWVSNYEQIPEGYVAQRLADCKFVVCASPDYLIRHGTPTHPDDLRKHNCIIYRSKQRHYPEWAFKKDDEEIMVPVAGNYSVDLAEAVRDATIAGAGISYLATYLLKDEFRTGKLVQVLPDWQTSQKMPFHIIYPSRQHLPRKLSTVITAIKEHVGLTPYWDTDLKKWINL
ncbi:LysR family transcriptional regulator [Veronia pacifica]|uniref:LysR family transcriptional regulator n=1 Tax=Veronia pacifica TaxID=1080227 RepID=A0A1C3E7H7_9GAMM|nr:LysR family transcriptional regulator [Veronia pacifica]ODA29164.1 LysR family transcriptional regulator [Veronia pacifica]